jgi:hypothetical protein
MGGRGLVSPKMLSLQDFIRRQQVLRLYRSAWRTAQSAPDDGTRQELRQQIRQEFELGRSEEDARKQKYLIHTGQGRLQELGNMLGYRHSLKPGGLPQGF